MNAVSHYKQMAIARVLQSADFPLSRSIFFVIFAEKLEVASLEERDLVRLKIEAAVHPLVTKSVGYLGF